MDEESEGWRTEERKRDDERMRRVMDGRRELRELKMMDRWTRADEE